MNSISIHGRLTRDVELKSTQSGKSVATFSVAVDRAYKAADGSKQTDFFNCTAWGGAADVIAQYFSKGSEIVDSIGEYVTDNNIFYNYFPLCLRGQLGKCKLKRSHCDSRKRNH